MVLLWSRSGRTAGEAWIHRPPGLPLQVWHWCDDRWSRLLCVRVVICECCSPVNITFLFKFDFSRLLLSSGGLKCSLLLRGEVSSALSREKSWSFWVSSHDVSTLCWMYLPTTRGQTAGILICVTEPRMFNLPKLCCMKFLLHCRLLIQYFVSVQVTVDFVGILCSEKWSLVN